MTNKIEISRELAENIAQALSDDPAFHDDPMTADYAWKLRAILAKPPTCAESQVEPVAYMRNEGTPDNLVKCTFTDPGAFGVYRQTAPVVVPSHQEIHTLISKAARQADLTSGANYFTAAEFAAIVLLDKVKELNS